MRGRTIYVAHLLAIFLMAAAVFAEEKLPVQLNPDSLRQEFSRIDTTNVRRVTRISEGRETSSIRMFTDLLFRIYSRFITTQDSHECQFDPSCSHYARQAMDRRHPAEALLMTGDRLLRCNPTAAGHYPEDSEGFLVDSVEVRR